MKTQIIKIIPCLLAGFILSACVGAVTIPSSVAEKKTGSEPIVLDPATILINRCIMDDNANDASCAPAVTENSCITDPFGAACDLTFTDFYETARANRISFCRKDSTNNLCVSAVKSVCDESPLDADLCFNDNTYYQSQESMCETDPTSPLCETTVSRVCGRDSLNVLCAGNETYYTAQKTACETYSTDTRCAQTIARVCSVDSLESLCVGEVAHFTAQKTACADESNSPSCPLIITELCDKTPFDTFCQSTNLTLRDIPISLHGGFQTTSDNTPRGSCYANGYFTSYYAGCWSHVPNVINIQPLNNTNIGTAIYAGAVTVQYASNSTRNYRRREYVYDYKPALTQNIDIIANFGDNTLSYSGDLVSNSNPFNINGNFTDRGIITGTVDFRGSETILYGLIGQNEAIGVFSDGSGNSSFAGGFTATRQPAE